MEGIIGSILIRVLPRNRKRINIGEGEKEREEGREGEIKRERERVALKVHRFKWHLKDKRCPHDLTLGHQGLAKSSRKMNLHRKEKS